METRARKRLAWSIAVALVVLALASLIVGGLALLERYGVVTLRRVPNPILCALGEDGESCDIAVINADTTSGSFRLAVFPPEDYYSGRRTSKVEVETRRVWVPARTISLRKFSWVGARTVEIRLDHDGQVTKTADTFFRDGQSYKFVARGAPVALEWHGLPGDAKPRTFALWTNGPGVSIVPAEGLEVLRHLEPRTFFRWDGRSKVVIEADAAIPGPGWFAVTADCMEGPGHADYLLVHDPDMKIIDERDSPRGP